MNLKFKNFENTLLKNSEEVDSFIKKNLPRNEGLNKKLIQAIKYSILGSGKKIRSFLVIEVGKVVSNVNNLTLNKKKRDELIVIASAIEAIHTYSLIHDDLPAMDNSDYRRGKKSTHKKFDEATAILAGDALQSLSYEIICDDTDMNDSSKISAISILSKACGKSGMVFGQYLDIESESKAISHEDIEKIHSLKTGELIKACVLLGQTGNEDISLTKLLENVGQKIGLAFQITDDILEEVSDEKTLGKNVNSDKRNDKSTYLKVVSLHEAINISQELPLSAISDLKKLKNKRFDMLIELAKYISYRNN